MAALAARNRAYEDGNAAESELLRETFNSLLDTVLTRAEFPTDQAQKWRNRGWAEIAHLFADADDSFDPKQAARARFVLTRRINVCRDVLL